MQLTKRSVVIILGFVLLGISFGMGIKTGQPDDKNYQQFLKLQEAYVFISSKYVEEINTPDLVENAIEGMIDGLDPHSIYINTKRMKRVRESFNAAFEGIGIQYEIIRDTIVVMTPLPGGPSEAAGILSGDRLVAVNDTSTIGFTNADIQNLLKGKEGSPVNVVIRRPQNAELLIFSLMRDRIPLRTVDAAYMLDERTGYIKVNRFARTTYSEFYDALQKLRNDGMKRLVFDLRGNSGGYMDMAIRICNEFLERGEMIVYTRSRHQNMNQEFLARGRGTFGKQPIILLIDENSASASEIVAGALQDHDRALLVGRRTFGKGLVQQQFPLQDGSVLQMTISRYYTPSGRLIQTPYTKGDSQGYYDNKVATHDADTTTNVSFYIDAAPDSLHYTTDGGRVVLGGGGVLPDFMVSQRETADFTRAIIENGLDNQFILDYFDRQNKTLREKWQDDQAGFYKEFARDGQLWSAFKSYIQDEGFTVVSVADTSVALQFSVSSVENEQITIEARMRAYAARRLWGISAWYPAIQEVDRTLQASLELWENAEALARREISAND